MDTSSLFPIVEYGSSYQWNIVLSFAKYLSERDAGVDYKAAEGVLAKRDYLKTTQLDNIQLLCTDGLPESMALAIKYQDELADAFAKMTFDLFKCPGERSNLFEDIFDDILTSSDKLNMKKQFTRFDAVCVFLRYAVKFELSVILPGPNLADTFMQPFIWTMQNTTKFNSEEKKQLAFLAQSISAFRLSPEFPCQCEYGNQGMSLIALGQGTRVNGWNYVFQAVTDIASGQPLSSPGYTDPTEIGPVLCAWLMLSPRRRETFVGWVLGRPNDFRFVNRLFSKSESPNGAARLLTFINANIGAANEETTKSKSKPTQSRNPLFDL